MSSLEERGTLYLTGLERKAQDALDAMGVVYYRQYSTRTGFILDFALPEFKLALEVDGPHHDTSEHRKKDRFRDHQLSREGWKVVRIHHSEIENNPDLPSLLLTRIQSVSSQ